MCELDMAATELMIAWVCAGLYLMLRFIATLPGATQNQTELINFLAFASGIVGLIALGLWALPA